MKSDALFSRLANPTTTARTEADIQSDVKMLLLEGGFGLDTPRLEEQVSDGTRRRIDVAVGATVIEVKRDLSTVSGLSAFEEQLAGYVRARTEQERSRYNGILTDGRRWRLYELDPADSTFQLRSSFELTIPQRGEALIDWLQAVLATRSEIAPTRNNIETYLGSESPAYEQDLAYLRGLWAQLLDDETVKLKRELWARLLRSALGTGFDEVDDLFFDHTILVIEAAAIGHAIMDIPLEELVQDPRRLLDGGEFFNAGIHNVIESDFFDWVLAKQSAGQRFVAQVIRRIAVFNWEETEHDVLKVLYESVINKETRKGLGEYYTPDWLAEGIVEKTVTRPLEQKVLDPACGSGTFIFHAVRRAIAAAETQGWRSRDIVAHVQSHVFGLDIHPVSVMLARITYLLALGGYLRAEREDVYVPVHLGDSMQWYQPARGHEDKVSISTESQDLTVGEESTLFDIGKTLVFPLANITHPDEFDRLVHEMTGLAQTYSNSSRRRPSIDPVLRKFGITDQDDADILRRTFILLCDLNAEGRDSIWGYYVRNQVRPLWLTMAGRQVDALIGNPPWVAYRYMTSELQRRFREFSEARDLWAGRKLATNEDLVGLFIVRAVEQYLNTGGVFGFVTPLAVLSRQTYSNFRSGRWGGHLRGDFTELWDLKDVTPKNGLFPVPAAVVFGRRDWADKPIGSAPPRSGMPNEKLAVTGKREVSGWDASKTALTWTPTVNVTIDDDAYASDYRKFAVQGATLTPRSLFFVTIDESAPQSRLGLSRGRVAIQPVRSTQEKTPWKELPSVASSVVESRHVFDTHLGETVLPFRTLQPLQAVLPVDKGRLLTEKEISTQGGGISTWWAAASDVWDANRSAKAKETNFSLRDRLNYQNGLVKQLSGGGHRVVYSASGNTLTAARIADTKTIIEHALYWLNVSSEAEARYLVAVLNAPLATEVVSVYQSVGLQGARHFDNYVWRMPIPQYNPNEELHQRLSHLGAESERTANEVMVERTNFKSARNLIRESLRDTGLTSQLDVAVAELLHLHEE